MNAHEIVSHVLKKLIPHTRVGVDTLTLNNIAESEVLRLGGIPINKGYKPEWAASAYPAVLCTSINEELAHGIPSYRKLKEGDLITYDLGVRKNGLAGDAAITVGVGKLEPRDRALLKTGKKALLAGIAVLRDGVQVREIAKAIEKVARSKGFVVNRSFTGHGIGKQMHEAPHIYHTNNWLFNHPEEYKKFEKYMNITLHAGDVICLEPIVTYRDHFGRKSKDGWAWVTKDGKKAVMFEHMIRITETGHEVLTTHIKSVHKKGAEMTI